MQKFLKLLVGVLILAAIILAAPFGMGIVAEKEAHKKIKEAQAKLVGYPNVEYKLTRYKRGFFKSEAEELIIFKNLKVDGKEIGPIELILADEISHGPVIVSQNDKGKWDFWVGRAMIKSKLKKVLGLNISPLPLDFYMGYIGFGGDVKLVVDVPKLALEFSTFSVVLENFKNTLELSRDHKKITNQFILKNAAIVDKVKPQKLDLKGLEISTDISKDSKGLWLGSRKIEIESLVAGIEGSVYTLKSLYGKTRDFEHDKQIKSEVILNVRSAGVGEKSYGPHRLALEVDGVDASLLSKINETFMKIHHEQMEMLKTSAGTTPASIEAAKNQVLISKVGDLGVDLIKRGFSIDLKSLEASTAWGTLTASARIKIPNLSDQQKSLAQLSLLTSLLNMDSTINAQIPSGLIKAAIEARYHKMLEAQGTGQTPQPKNIEELAEKHLAKLVADGWFTPKGDLYEISLSFKKGEFLVNNKPLKPQGLLPELGPQAPNSAGEGQSLIPNAVPAPADPSATPSSSQPEESAKQTVKPQAQNVNVPVEGALSPVPEKPVPSNDVHDSPISQPTQKAPQPTEVIQSPARPASPEQTAPTSIESPSSINGAGAVEPTVPQPQPQPPSAADNSQKTGE